MIRDYFLHVDSKNYHTAIGSVPTRTILTDALTPLLPSFAVNKIADGGVLEVGLAPKVIEAMLDLPHTTLQMLTLTPTEGKHTMIIKLHFTGDRDDREAFKSAVRFIPGVGPARATRIANGEIVEINTTPAALDKLSEIANLKIITDDAKTAQTETVQNTVTGTQKTKTPAELLAEMLAGLTSGVDPQVLRDAVRDEVSNVMTEMTITTIEIKRHDAETITVTGHHHPLFSKLLRVMASRNVSGYVPNIWLSGPTASGKTTAARKAAEALGLPFYAHGACVMGHELIGFVDGAGNYHQTQFVTAYRDGGVVLLDEVDAYDNAALMPLQAATANAIMALPDGTMLERHKDCIIIAAANTWGQGATAEYVGRMKLDAAFLSRFPIKFAWDRDEKLEQAICGNVEWAKRVQAARRRAAAAGLKVLIDPRHSIDGAALIATGFTPDETAELTYLAGLTKEQRNQIEERH
jgi:hypothetical protein